MKKIGILGSSFNPPTLAHQDVLIQAQEQFDLILLIPSVAHAFGKKMAPLSLRMTLLRLFWMQLNMSCPVKIFNIESAIYSICPKRPVYTYDVLNALEDYYSIWPEPFSLTFIMGPDNATQAQWQQFHRYRDIELKWAFFVAQERLAIHSSHVRQVFHETEDKNARYTKLLKLVPKPIALYLIQNPIYSKI